MKYLFIINPALKGIGDRLSEIQAEIAHCFARYPHLSYDIHVTRWQRDAVGFVQRYCQNAPELVRVVAVGGVGTLYEALNGVMELPNTQLAYCPFGKDNAFIRVFGERQSHFFNSVSGILFAKARRLDVIHCGDCGYALSFSLFGMEALLFLRYIDLRDRYQMLPSSLAYLCSLVGHRFHVGQTQEYQIVLDGETRLEGAYKSGLIANQPCHGFYAQPVAEARPDDGMLDLYLWKKIPSLIFPRVVMDYVKGEYHKWPEYIEHYRFRHMAIQSEDLFAVSPDGEFSFQLEQNYLVLPNAVDFVFPEGVEYPERRAQETPDFLPATEEGEIK
ncbi:MAG: hypothetical protein LBG69_06285 [Zoogloeaceae bacterium]|jgi:diacylglycerol kinase family enzyme|nr:hypothetical protein [Zoogloeaceae bacterium]